MILRCQNKKFLDENNISIPKSQLKLLYNEPEILNSNFWSLKQIALEDDNAKQKVNICYQVLFENHILINDVTAKSYFITSCLTKPCKAISKSTKCKRHSDIYMEWYENDIGRSVLNVEHQVSIEIIEATGNNHCS